MQAILETNIGTLVLHSTLRGVIPASINGIGLREAAAVALYTSPAIGLPLAVAVLTSSAFASVIPWFPVPLAVYLIARPLNPLILAVAEEIGLVQLPDQVVVRFD